MSVPGKTDNDASTAHAELEQGLRSGRLGEQSEAIVKYPKHFATYPFPILINSGLLRLADVFRQGSNFIRLSVLGVVRQSEQHLDKVTNVDEFLRRIFAVIHCNDPIARALTLRTLGAVASIVPEKEQIHHNIRSSLDSRETVELSAAIYAAGRFAAQSKTFAVNMCSKISEMIQGYTTPLKTKLQLIPILQHMHHDAHTADMVRKTCVEILSGYPSQEFVVVTLHTLTLLSTHTLVDIPEQVELLLKHLNEDPRKIVKKQILADLRFLSHKDRAHLWNANNVSSVIKFALSCVDVDEGIVGGALMVLCDLVEYTSIRNFNLEDSSSPVIHLCQTCSYSSSFSIMSKSTKLLTLLAANSVKEMHKVNGTELVSEAIMAIEALFLLINSEQQIKPGVILVLKECLHCVIVLCKVQPDSCDQFVDVIGGMLTTATDETATLICEVLSALGNMKAGVLKQLLPDICHLLNTLDPGHVDGDKSEKNRCKVLSFLATMLFQTQKGYSWTEEAVNAVRAGVDKVDFWTAYTIGRNAARSGHYEIASEIFKNVSLGVSSEHFYFWIKGLSELSGGEAHLNNVKNPEIVDRLNLAETQILNGRTSIKASPCPLKSMDFQSEYLRCRAEMIQTICQMVDSCRSIKTCPPSAIATAQAKQSHDDLQRSGRISHLLRQCVKDFARVGTAFGQLYEMSFDADSSTLAQLSVLQQLNVSMSLWLESVCLKSSLHGSIYNEVEIEFSPRLPKNINDYGIDVQDLVTTGQAVASCFERLVSDPNTPPPITNVHVECLMEVTEILASNPIGLPRFFFQSLQSTSLKLVVSPTSRSPNEPMLVNCSHHTAFKVEGVLAKTSTTKCFINQEQRKVASVKIVLASVLQSSKQSNDLMKLQDINQTLEQIVTPHNNFFSAQFLIPFAVLGIHVVSVDAWLIDGEGHRWRTGERVTILVKSYEDPQNRTTQARPLPPRV